MVLMKAFIKIHQILKFLKWGAFDFEVAGGVKEETQLNFEDFEDFDLFEVGPGRPGPTSKSSKLKPPLQN